MLISTTRNKRVEIDLSQRQRECESEYHRNTFGGCTSTRNLIAER